MRSLIRTVKTPRWGDAAAFDGSTFHQYRGGTAPTRTARACGLGSRRRDLKRKWLATTTTGAPPYGEDSGTTH